MSRLHEQYMNILIREIVTGVHPEGSLLPREVELVEQYGVSRGVVRECLRGLEERGLVAVRHGKGAQVLSESYWDLFESAVFRALVDSDQHTGRLREYLECRKVIEVEAAGLAAIRATPEQVHDLNKTFQRLADASQEQRVTPSLERQYHEADISFHYSVAAASGNRALARLVHEVHRSLVPRQVLARPQARHDQILSEHRQILDAVSAHEPEAARHAMSHHLSEVEEFLAAHGHSEAATASSQRDILSGRAAR